MGSGKLENTVKSMAKVVSRGLPGTKARICDPRASDYSFGFMRDKLPQILSLSDRKVDVLLVYDQATLLILLTQVVLRL